MRIRHRYGARPGVTVAPEQRQPEPGKGRDAEDDEDERPPVRWAHTPAAAPTLIPRSAAALVPDIASGTTRHCSPGSTFCAGHR